MSRLATFLAGIRVLDLSQYIPGPMASLVLADMGAEVVKVEPPGGDEMRNLGPRDASDAPVFYGALNAGKSVRRMNLKNPKVRAALLDEVPGFDVLIEGFRPGVMGRLGLDYATVSGLNPRLVYCSISGYGARGAQTAKAAHDGNYLATSGILDRNGREGPDFFDPPLSDVAGSLYAVTAILGALHGRHATGRGCEIDLGLADVAMPLQLMHVADYGANRHVPRRRTTYLNGGAAYYQIYRTRDGRDAMLGPVEPKFWANFCRAAERPDWIGRQADPLPQAALIAELAAFFAGLTLAECEARFAAVDCCFSPVLDLGEAIESEQTRARGLVRDGPGGLQALFPVLIDGERPAPRARLRDGGADRRAAE